MLKVQKNFGFMVLCLATTVSALAAEPSTTSVTTSPLPQTTSTTTTALPVLSGEIPKKFSITTGLEYSQKVEVEENTERESSTDLSLVATYKINDLYSLLAKTAVTQELNGPQNSSLSDTTVGFSVKGVKTNDQWITTHSMSAILPTSETSQERDRLRTAVAMTNGVSYSGDLLKAKYSLGLSKNFHEFDQNAEGTFLNEYRITNLIDLVVPLTDKFSVSVSGLYRISYTYDGTDRYGFGTFGDLNYDFSEKLSSNIGVSTEGNALKSNGVDSNISVYDDTASVVRAGLTYVY
jgi:hypothetical protein